MAIKLMGKKRGMTQRFDDQGNLVACTVIELEPNVVTQVKTKATDGYSAVQVGAGKVTAKDPRCLEARTTKPLRGHFAKNAVAPRRHLGEFRVEDEAAYTTGQELGVTLFAKETRVDVTSVSRGKGHQGVMKRHGYKGGPGAHGSSFHRHAGSTGMRSSPGRVLPGLKKSGHMGDRTVTTQNLRVVEVDEELNLLCVRGAVPGAPGALVVIAPAVKQRKAGASKKTPKKK